MSNNNNTQLPEEMASFFEVRAEGYDEHMENNICEFENFYDIVSSTIEKTNREICILDIGCGTGLEIEGIIEKAPNANILGIDICKRMLEILEKKYINNMNQIRLINDSYLSYPFEMQQYDYVISVMTMHHYLYKEKCDLYKRIKQSLGMNGIYIEGDYIVSKEQEADMVKQYYQKIKLIDNDSLCHIDIPMSEENQISVMRDAGFTDIEIIFKADSNRVIVAK